MDPDAILWQRPHDIAGVMSVVVLLNAKDASWQSVADFLLAFRRNVRLERCI